MEFVILWGKMDKEKIINIVLKTLKLIVFGSFLFTAVVMYYLGNVQWGNDILLTAMLFVILNKLDNVSN